MSAKIDIIVPVYRGLEETRHCLESVIRATNRCSTKIVVIDDCSPEPPVSAYLRSLRDKGQITLLVNPENLGFVRTVNRGMELHADRDVILLNSDTEVAGDWVDRLKACAHSHPKIGTVTPFSGNATICSYPRFCEANELPPELGLEKLDQFFRDTLSGKSLDLPTGVGFCFYIRRDCLREIGLFDVASFGKGYGEENDFCRRAVKSGWRNVLAADTYVRHVGGISFGASQTQRMKEASRVLLQKHPEYDREVHAHFVRDPARPFRLSVDVQRLRASLLPKLLFINHRLGGGTEKHVEELAALMRGKAHVLLLTPAALPGRMELSWLDSSEAFRLYFTLPSQLDALILLLRDLDVAKVHYHHTLGLDSLPADLPKRLGVPYDFTAHDFYSLCPRIHLTQPDAQGRYCGEPDESACDSCLRKPTPVQPANVREWRENFRALLEGADRVIAPSRFVSKRIEKHFAKSRIVVAPHSDSETQTLNQPPTVTLLSQGGVLEIAVLGTLDQKKGRDILLACAELSTQKDLPLRFHLLGALHPRTTEAPPNDAIHIRPYQGDKQLSELLSEVKPHIVWFPALMPETYSYTLSATLRHNLPVVTTDLGALPERLAGRSWSWLEPWTQTPSEWLESFMRIRRTFLGELPPVTAPGTQPTYSPWYGTHYLASVQARAPQGLLSHLPDRLSPFAYAPPTQSLLKRALVHLNSAGHLNALKARMPHQLKMRVKSWISR